MSLQEHLASGLTTVCRCWAVTRRDGRVFGFTDHDEGMSFEGVDFKADTGLTASALQQVTGLAVDNTEAVGALSDEAVTEADINAGRFDGAEVTAWLVNWRDVTAREVQFKGSIGELKRADGAFHAELRGLSEVLNTPVGRVYQKPCQAVLGDRTCCVDLTTAGYRTEVPIEQVEAGRVFRFSALAGFDDRWFERGRLEVRSGQADGLVAMVKNDRMVDGARVIELWEELRMPVEVGDIVLLEAGCDKRIETCRLKFQNIANFQGFPHIPGEDWLMTYPQDSGANDGGSRYK
ncbi:putative phage protein (TIGR02218 family) [Litoreibacter halocynthiae]|uniref:Putative phage protein (TIGR02218 family) n=1 Tax=Litoreibacter halocynthiae TaxID=1242689 RepID=A0A4R7LSJ7_9RHOB|nr:DUF2163 domain-containing protein [Litoreibacter halocynthiae]TDT78046.1 putative phage protein (TIGR02218 family) [Litoreibacter halocynthiae]